MSMNEPVGHTCPDINNCLKWLKRASESISAAIEQIESLETNDDVSPIIADLRDAANHIDIEGELEQLRDSNSSLRGWGLELAQQIENHEP